MIAITDGGTDKLQIITYNAKTIDVHATHIDYSAASPPVVSAPTRTNSAIASATTTDIVAKPAAGTRILKTLHVRNKDTAFNIVTVQFNANGTITELYKTFMFPGGAFQYKDGYGFEYLTQPDGKHVLAYATPVDVDTAADNTTLTNITNINFPYEANATYYLKYYGIHQSAAATTGIGLALICSTSVTTVLFTAYHQLANTGTLSALSSIASNTITGVTSALPNLATNVPVSGAGILATSTTAGLAQLRLRAEAAAVTTVKAGSILLVERIV